MNFIAIASLVSVLFLGGTSPRLPRQEPKTCEIISEIKLSPSEEVPMKPIVVKTTITNCGPIDKVFRVIGGQQSSCGHFLVFADDTAVFRAGESHTITGDSISAPDSCPGPVVIMVGVYEMIEEKSIPIAKRETVLKAKK